ncbi:hypothetical protein [Chryseobacterium kwangjuense]|uniref:Uncharacterized protein n=1 Tax=Chryseobacterium kwangjuense TaxID=267125 RepID=A0A135W6E3_9FLAO|nr:hypothetical protein [Chryseobacterium kwangjuense]KXH80466.1 hypothetical protein AU378_18890 [Chryseobacterium kwangjuense]
MSLIVTDIDSDYQSLLDNKDFTAVNFPIEKAVKIYGNSYSRLRGKNKLKSEIEKIIGFKDDHLNSCEAIENFLVFTYYLLKTNDKLVVFTAGLSYDSIDHYIRIMEIILPRLGNRTLYVVKNFTDINESQLTDLYIHINKIEKEIIFDFMKNWLIGFKPKNEYFRYPEYFGKMEFETEDYFEMLSFILSEPNRNYEFYFINKNNSQYYPKGMILINNNSMYLGIGVNKSCEKDFIDKLTKEYDKIPIISNWLQLPY